MKNSHGLSLRFIFSNFSPEYEPAGDEYNRAGQAYKVAKKYNDSLVSIYGCL